MILGEVTPDREAVIRLVVRGPSQLEAEIEAIVDTGFTEFLTLPSALVGALQLPFRGSSRFTLADGTVAPLDSYRVTVVWDGRARVVPVLAAEGGPLVGMSLLYGSRVTLDIADGGPVIIEALP